VQDNAHGGIERMGKIAAPRGRPLNAIELLLFAQTGSANLRKWT
jgi:hypothetical protein